MDLTVIGYLLFVIPGFCLVWTYRHFTRAKTIGDFEYAIWSFLWGTVLFLSTTKLIERKNISLPLIDMNNPITITASFLGMGLGIAFGISFLLGYAGALLHPAFKWIDEKLFLLIKKL